jgi:hypothetical protein
MINQRAFWLTNKKQFLYRPRQVLRGLREVKAPRISRHSAHEGVNLVSLKHRPPLPHRNYYSFFKAESTPGSQCGRNVYVHNKNPMPQWRIEPVTFRPVAQCPHGTCKYKNEIVIILKPRHSVHLLILLHISFSHSSQSHSALYNHQLAHFLPSLMFLLTASSWLSYC